MTTVYGVTFIGAKRQIEKQLKERGDIPPEHLYMCALYLGRIVLDSIGDVFKGATAIQNWLNRSARLISKSIPPGRIEAASLPHVEEQGRTSKVKKTKKSSPGLSRIPKEQMTSVIWTTPLGLPVVQPYRKPKKRQVSLSSFSVRSKLTIWLDRSLLLCKLYLLSIRQFLPKSILVLKLPPSRPTLFIHSMRLI